MIDHQHVLERDQGVARRVTSCRIDPRLSRHQSDLDRGLRSPEHDHPEHDRRGYALVSGHLLPGIDRANAQLGSGLRDIVLPATDRRDIDLPDIIRHVLDICHATVVDTGVGFRVPIGDGKTTITTGGSGQLLVP